MKIKKPKMAQFSKFKMAFAFILNLDGGQFYREILTFGSKKFTNNIQHM